MLRSLPNERLTPTYSAAFFTPLPQAGGVGGGHDCAAIATSIWGEVGTRFVRSTLAQGHVPRGDLPLKGRS
jgi:hypothetical protein